jgi:TRAP-type C4-dicarboxylate transport system permease small subunit
MLEKLRGALERGLEIIVAILLIAIVVVVVMGVSYRKFGDSLVWYDEIASILLAWLTYYGAALAALKRAHIGFSGLVDALPHRWRLAAILLAETLVIGFFLLLAWVGFYVLQVLEGDTLVSLPQVPIQLTQSVIPIGALLFVFAQLLSLPAVLKAARVDRHGPHLPGSPHYEP